MVSDGDDFKEFLKAHPELRKLQYKEEAEDAEMSDESLEVDEEDEDAKYVDIHPG